MKFYHLHLRKTAGRSVHHAVLKQTGQDSNHAYLQLARRPGEAVAFPNIRVGGWVSDLSKDFEYGFSHQPIYKLGYLTPDIFMLCCFRDPVNRFLSYWKMLRDYLDLRPTLNELHPSLEEEVKTYDDDILACFDKTPDIHRNNQIYMFSASGSYIAAKMNLHRMNLIMESEELQAGLNCLGRAMGRDLGHIPLVGVGKAKADIDTATRRNLRDRLSAEYDLIAEARQMKTHYSNAILGERTPVDALRTTAHLQARR